MTERKTFLTFILLLTLLFNVFSVGAKKYTIGFSQCTTTDLWRQTQQRLMQIELSFHPEMELYIKDAKEDNQTQIEQIESFLQEGIDLLIVSPNESAPITPIVEKVFDSGIPVIVVDRKIESNKYTAYIGGDNYRIGQEAGKYTVELLKGKGKILEISGLEGSSPATERRKGFEDVISNYPEINIVFSASGEWNEEGAREAMQKVLKTEKDFDLVFAHNDVMAREAYKVAYEQGIQKDLFFLGIDGLPGVGGGIEAIINGKLDATFLYPTGGEEAIQTAYKILNQQPFVRDNVMQTIVIDSNNAQVLKLQSEQIEALQQKIEAQRSVLDLQISRYQSQRLMLLLAITLLVMIVILAIVILNAFRNKKMANEKLEVQNREIEKQNTAILKQRDELIKISEQLEEATQAKLRFFTNISHEFRTPLTLIKGPLENMMESSQYSEMHQNQFRLMHQNTIRLMRLVNQLMDFRKLENKKMDLVASENDLILFLKEIEESFSSLAQSRNIRFSFISEEEHLFVWFDRDKMDKVFFNILSNAYKFTSDGGEISITLKKHRSQTPGINPDEVQIIISDTGTGIATKHLDKIFDRFYQVGKSQTFNGTGLGLSLSKEFIEIHHGRIKVESDEGKGTTFYIYLPLGNQHLRPEEMVAEETIPKHLLNYHVSTPKLVTSPGDIENKMNQAEKPLILLVEDMADVRDFIRFSLGNKYQIVEAANGKSGIEMALKEEPDLIISDVMMPEMDGLELTRLLKTDIKTCHIPIILLTAKAELEHKLEGLEEGADSYIPKPFNSKHLQIRVKKLLELRSKIREHYKVSLDFREDFGNLSRMDRKFINELTRIIEQNIGKEDLSVDELGQRAGMSRVHLYRKIKKLTDMSVSEFANSVKLRKSLELLKNSGKSIAEIAYESGFSSPSYFTRCFKDQFKMSPSEFRQRTEY
ncbi:hybrid sensor histidine kinase/response regulator transcription factor [Mariniphaga sediminis]|nr:substrate-binding domain-containing protein [Mariniphaga sediminis]